MCGACNACTLSGADEDGRYELEMVADSRTYRFRGARTTLVKGYTMPYIILYIIYPFTAYTLVPVREGCVRMGTPLC